jgi:hypothetical protein
MTKLLVLSLIGSVACTHESDPDISCHSRESSPIGKESQELHGGISQPGFIPLDSSHQGALVVIAPNTSDVTQLCSGVLVSPRLVLTAKHCQFDGDPRVYFASSGTGDFDVEVTPSELVPHPTLDLLLLRLPEQSAPAAPIPVLDTPLDSRWVGAVVQLAGAGQTSSGDIGVKRYAAEPIVSLDDDSIEVDGAGRTGACEGDSGGPLLGRGLDGTARVLGILSEGSPDCMGIDRYIRLDKLKSWLGDDGYASPAADGCGDIDGRGLCQAGIAMWCDDGSIAAQDCQDDAGSCDWDPDSGGFRCQQAGGSCGDSSASGRCDGTKARWCSDGTPVELDCSLCGTSCSRDPQSGVVGCGGD